MSHTPIEYDVQALYQKLTEPHFLSDDAKARMPIEGDDLITLYRNERREVKNLLDRIFSKDFLEGDY